MLAAARAHARSCASQGQSGCRDSSSAIASLTPGVGRAGEIALQVKTMLQGDAHASVAASSLRGAAALPCSSHAGSAPAQDMTTSDVTRLEQSVDQIRCGSRQAAAARSCRRAFALQTELTDLDEEVTYLKVKLRKERVVSRVGLHRRPRPAREPARACQRHRQLRRPLRQRRAKQRRDRVPSNRVIRQPGVVPAGTELDVRLERR